MPDEGERYQAKINMWLKDIERLDAFFKFASQCILALRNRPAIRDNPTLILMGVDSLNEAGRILRALCWTPNQRKEYDGRIRSLWKLAEIETEQNLTNLQEHNLDLVYCSDKLFYKIDNFYNYLLDLRQQLGLGITMEKKEDIEAKLRELAKKHETKQKESEWNLPISQK